MLGLSQFAKCNFYQFKSVPPRLLVTSLNASHLSHSTSPCCCTSNLKRRYNIQKMSIFQPSNPEVQKISLLSIPKSKISSHTLIFFITGNPGLIGYYSTYLQTLHNLLKPNSESNSACIHIYGQSLAGFVDDPTSSSAMEPHSLEAQINILQRTLENAKILDGPQRNQSYDNIILIGHSVGSYILLELVRRLHKSSSPFEFTAGILLFPTITHIAQSPSGIKISRLFQWSDSPRKVGQTLQRLFILLPKNTLTWLVSKITRMPLEFAVVTTEFLRSKIGIWQALHMARDEMDTITEDKWSEEVWGVEGPDQDSKQTPVKLIAYFGKNDHWVADHTRDALIASRGRIEGDPNGTKPLMLIDQQGIPHGFCLKHGEIMAEKTKVWIEEILWQI